MGGVRRAGCVSPLGFRMCSQMTWIWKQDQPPKGVQSNWRQMSIFDQLWPQTWLKRTFGLGLASKPHWISNWHKIIFSAFCRVNSGLLKAAKYWSTTEVSLLRLHCLDEWSCDKGCFSSSNMQPCKLVPKVCYATTGIKVDHCSSHLVSVRSRTNQKCSPRFLLHCPSKRICYNALIWNLAESCLGRKKKLDLRFAKTATHCDLRFLPFLSLGLHGHGTVAGLDEPCLVGKLVASHLKICESLHQTAFARNSRLWLARKANIAWLPVSSGGQSFVWVCLTQTDWYVVLTRRETSILFYQIFFFNRTEHSRQGNRVRCFLVELLGNKLIRLWDEKTITLSLRYLVTCI